MPRQPDHPHVVAEVLPAELGADAELAGELQHLLLQVAVAEGVAQFRTRARQRVEVARRRQLGDLEGVLGRHPADDDGEVVGRAGGGAERAQLLVEERRQPARVQQRLRLLVEERLVRRAPTLGQHQQFVLRRLPGHRVQLDLGGQVGAGVALLPERGGRHLGVAQVQLVVGLEDAAGDGLLVFAAGQHGLRALADDDRGAGVLAHRQHAARGDAGVAQQVGGDEPVVGRGLGVVDDRAQLGQVRRPQQVLDVLHRLADECGERGGVDLEERPARGLDDGAGRQRQAAVVGLVRAERKQVGVVEAGHGKESTPGRKVGPAPGRSDPPGEAPDERTRAE